MRFLLFAFVFVASSFLQAQPNLYFINKVKNKVIEVKIGQQLSLKYSGYLGQPEFSKQTVTDISDSFVVLGFDPEALGKTFAKSMSNNPKFVHKKIMLKDILAFRRMTSGRQLLKSTLLLGNIFASSYLLSNLYNDNSITNFQRYFISLGVGFGASILISAIMPENPKYHLNDGWEVRVAYEKPKL